VFACGRYEGIDQRVVEHYSQHTTVMELSIGDFVINGGEVAVLAMLEAIVRLIPGFMGNPESLVEESHESGLLEYPSFTKPRSWRGLEVPEVLLSGNHEAIRQWREDQSRARTAAMRPDLLED
jgi:tRNA (guanine37-N1)-methyltransferase